MVDLVSIGYECRDLSILIDDLGEQGVGVVVDVRLNPVSRKPGFSKRRLAEALSVAGIGYVHLRALGNPRDNRAGYRAGREESRDLFRAILARAPATAALQQIVELMDQGPVALLCFEQDHFRCHRELIAEALATGPGDGRLSIVQL